MRMLPAWLGARIAHRPVLTKLLDNIAWLLLDKALKLGLNLFVAVWLARYLGPDGFGLYSYVVAFVAMFSGLATLGLPTIAVRELVREPDRRAEILGTAAIVLLGGAVVAGLLVIVGAGIVRPGDTSVRVAVAVVAGTLVFQSSAVVRYWFESQVASRYVVAAEAAALLISAALRVALILQRAPLEAFFWMLLAESALLCAFLLVVYVRQTGDLRCWRATWERARLLLRNSWPLALSGAILMVQARLDQFMLAELASDRELGYYSAALRIAEGLVFFSLVLQSSLFPVLVEARRQSADVYRAKLMVFYRVSFLAALAVCVPVAALGPWVVALLFGAAYEPAGPILALMSGRVFLAFMGVARGLYLTIENLQGYAAFTLAVGTAVNLLLNLSWIPPYHAVGAVCASLVSFAVTSFVVDLAFPRVRGNVFDIFRAMATPLRLRRL